MNKIAIIILGIILVGAVGAASYIFSISPVSYPAQTPQPEKSMDTISFKCDGVSGEVSGHEPNGDWDENDLLSSIRKNCSGSITNIMKDGDAWQENAYGKKSFSVEELKKDECLHEGMDYDSKTNDCVVPSVGQIEP